MNQPVSEGELCEHIGGDPATTAVVERLYQRVIADPELRDFFNCLSTSRLKARQLALLSQTLGGLKQYSGVSIHDVQSRLSIEQRQFVSVAVLPLVALRELSIPEEIFGNRRSVDSVFRTDPQHPC